MVPAAATGNATRSIPDKLAPATRPSTNPSPVLTPSKDPRIASATLRWFMLVLSAGSDHSEEMTHLLVHQPDAEPYYLDGELIVTLRASETFPWAVTVIVDAEGQLEFIDTLACVYDGLTRVYGPQDLPLDVHPPAAHAWLVDHPYWDAQVCQSIQVDTVNHLEIPCEDPPAGSFGRHLCDDAQCSGWTFLCTGCLADCGLEPGWAQEMPWHQTNDGVIRSDSEVTCVVEDPEPWFACIRAMEEGMSAIAVLDLVDAADAAFLKAHPGQFEFVRPIVPGCDMVSERQVEILKRRAASDAPGLSPHLCIMVTSMAEGLFCQPVLMVGLSDFVTDRAKLHHPSRRQHRKGNRRQ